MLLTLETLAQVMLYCWHAYHNRVASGLWFTSMNLFVHSIMYTYYFVSMHTRDIWWKKYLTLAQLFQFTCMNGQALVLYATGCSDAPPRVTGLYFVYIVSLFVLFLQFFVASYVPKAKAA